MREARSDRFRRAARIAALWLAGAAFGCGGGGGGGEQLATITSVDAETMASEVLTGIMLSAELSELGAGIGGGGANAMALEGGVTLSATRAALATTLEEFDGIPRPGGGGIISPSAPFDPFPVDCAVSGTITFSGDVADFGMPSAGDHLIASFDQCDDGEIVLDGLFSLDIHTITGDLVGGEFTMDLSITLTDFVATVGADSVTSNGSANLSVDTTTLPLTITSIDGGQLGFQAAAHALTLLAFSTSLLEDSDLEEYEIAADGQITSSAFSGRLAYETLTNENLMGALNLGEPENPSDGIVLITGDSQATIRVVAVDDVNVDLEIDLDGDANVDEVQMTTWDALLD